MVLQNYEINMFMWVSYTRIVYLRNSINDNGINGILYIVLIKHQKYTERVRYVRSLHQMLYGMRCPKPPPLQIVFWCKSLRCNHYAYLPSGGCDER
jgi:hypothetical protein